MKGVSHPISRLEKIHWTSGVQTPTVGLVRFAAQLLKAAELKALDKVEGCKVLGTVKEAVIVGQQTCLPISTLNQQDSGPACTICETQNEIFFVWSGSDSIEKWWAQLNVTKFKEYDLKGYTYSVREGAVNHWSKLEKAVLENYTALVGKKQIIVIGNSEAADLATLTALAFALKPVNGLTWGGMLITFGGVAVGDLKFARLLDGCVGHIRLVRQYDPVPSKSRKCINSGTTVYLESGRGIYGVGLAAIAHPPVDLSTAIAEHDIAGYVEDLIKFEEWSPAPTFTGCCIKKEVEEETKEKVVQPVTSLLTPVELAAPAASNTTQL